MVWDSAVLEAFDYVIQPGWKGSEPEHWQSHWAQQLKAYRVENHDWVDPTPAAWLHQLDQTLRQAYKPVIIIAHSLGCVTVAHYLKHHPSEKLAGVFLVAPADVERQHAPECLARFAPVPTLHFPCPVTVIASDNDPFCVPQRAQFIAQQWGATLTWLPHAGHINVASGHTEWAEGLALLEQFALRCRQSALALAA